MFGLTRKVGHSGTFLINSDQSSRPAFSQIYMSVCIYPEFRLDQDRNSSCSILNNNFNNALFQHNTNKTVIYTKLK